MKILTKIRLLTGATALLPLTATAFAYPSLADPRFSGAAALGFSVASLLVLVGAGAGKAWLFGGGFRRIDARCAAIRAGDYDSWADLPNQGAGADENEFTAVLRSIDWMAHRIASREDALRAEIAEVEAAKALLETQGRELETANESLAALARTDPLTGLSNRRHFFEHFESELYRQPSRLAIILIDIDHFKRVNDAYGHQVGDGVLIDFAAVVRRSVRKSDMVARVGGEEFAVLLPEAGLDDALAVAESIRKNVSEAPFRLGDDPDGRVTCSLGAGAVALPPRPRAELLYRQADDALYEAKRNGRNRLYYYDESAEAAGLPAAALA